VTSTYSAWLPLLIVLALVVAAFAGARSPSPIRLEVVGDNFVVRLSGKDVLYAITRGMTIPISAIRGVAVAPTQSVPRTGMRLPGTGIPGVLRAGSYGTGSSRDFWLVRRPREVLVVELEPGEPYRRLVLEVPDPRAQCLRLRPLLGAYAGTFAA
jgi:hypothetical protein